MWRRIAEHLRAYPVIPAVRTLDDAREAATRPAAAVLVFKGSLFTLREVIGVCGAGRPVLVHIDLLEGIGKDEVGVQFLEELGVRGVTSTRAHLIRHARRHGLVAIQRLFAVDSDALATGVASARDASPHAVELLPGLALPHLMPTLGRDLGLPVIAAGLITRPEHIRRSLDGGAVGVSTSAHDLWGTPRKALG